MLHTLVLSPLTSFIDHNISPEFAYEIFKKCIIKYFQLRHDCDEIKIVFVESTPTVCASDKCKHTLESIREYSSGCFLTVEGKFSPKITQLVASGLFNKEDMTAIVNPTNHRLSGKGGYTNQLIHTAVGEDLEQSSLATQSDLSGAGHKAPLVFTVPLKEDNPFRVQEGYRAVIQTISPNFNPHRAHCEASLEAVGEALERSYDRIFEEFDLLIDKLKSTASGPTVGNIPQEHSARTAARLVDERSPKRVRSTSEDEAPLHTHSENNAIVEIDGSSSCAPVRSINDVLKDRTHRDGEASPLTTNKRPVVSSHSGGGGFGFNKNILFEYLRHPERHAASIYQQSVCCVVIRDAFPKARIHLLVLPKEGLLGDAIEVRQLRPEHLDNLRRVHAVARDIAVKLQSTSKHPILLGYHAVPSLHPLHIHIISSDFDSPALKTKKHWNSFTLSEHFIGIDRVEEWLAQGLMVDEQLLPEAELHDMVATTPLKCNQCQTSMSNMPNLKKHMATHL